MVLLEERTRLLERVLREAKKVLRRYKHALSEVGFLNGDLCLVVPLV